MKSICHIQLFILLSYAPYVLSQNSFADRWEYVGVAISEPGYTIWGSSPMMDEAGRVHLFVARWPSDRVDPDWRSMSEIAHYVGDRPEGPFRFSDIALQGSGKDTWDRYGVHNPNIQKVDNQYVLLYIANDNPNQPPHPSNQKIGMAISYSLSGPWQKVHGNGLILNTPEDSTFWNYKATNGVNNPAFLQHPNGKYFLYFKSHQSQMGLAIAENLTGPYIQLSHPVTNNTMTIEDGYAFIYEDRIALLTTDNHGLIEEGGGILWTSADGIRFDDFEKGFHRLNDYKTIDLNKVNVRYGPGERKYAKFERPQLLIIDGKPAYLYAPSGSNIFGDAHTVSYVLKFKSDE